VVWALGGLVEVPAHIWHSGHKVRRCQSGAVTIMRVTLDDD
jgi:hypothetical protein